MTSYSTLKLIVDIEKREINGQSNISLILVHRPPNTDCSLFFDDLEINISILSAENRHVFIFGDFNLDTFKSILFKTNKVDAENFTNILTGFNSDQAAFCNLIRQYLYKLSNHSRYL